MNALTYTDLFERAARARGPHTALIDDTGALTFADVENLTSRFANALRADGFAPETPFAIFGPNTSLALVAHIAGQRAGGAWANVNLRNSLANNIDILKRGKCAALFFHSSCAQMVAEILAEVETVRFAICLDRDIEGYPSIATYAKNAPYSAGNVHLEATHVGVLGSTGGTTGLPKITQSSQAFLSMSALGFMSAMPFDAAPVNLAVAPITHAGGLVALATLAMGGTVVMMSTPDLDKLLANIETHRVSLLFLPPTVIYMLMNHPKSATTDFSSLRYLMSSAAPITADKIAKAHEIFGPVICQCYAQTECGMPLTFISPAEVTQAVTDKTYAHRLRSAGRQAAIVSALEIMSETGEILPPGEIGEIVVRAPSVMFAYVGDPDATAEIKKFGWQHTGDVGYRDAEGYIYVTDRKRDLIITGGFNVFPLEVEEVLMRHSAVQDCAVIGVPDEKWGEAVKAVVELAPGRKVEADELIHMCKDALGSVKAPKTVDFMEQLPRSPVGKVLRREVRKLYSSTTQLTA